MKHPVIIGIIALIAAFPGGSAAHSDQQDAVSFALDRVTAIADGVVYESGPTQWSFSLFGFEPLAVKRASLPSLADKEAAVDEAIDALTNAISAEPGVELAIGSNGLDRLTYREDDDADGVADQIGKMLEVHFTNGLFSDELLLWAFGRHHAVAMPLGIIGVLTRDQGTETEIQVYAAQPETYVRVFWRDLEVRWSRKMLEALAAIRGNQLDTLVRDTLEKEGFVSCRGGGDCSNMTEGPFLPDAVIGVMEVMARILAGDPSYSLADYDHVAPSVTVGTVSGGASVEDVVDVIEKAIAAGTRGNIGEHELAEAFAAASEGDFAALNSILSRAPGEIWGKHKTLVDWVALRSLWFDQRTALVEACQPFYATTALGAPTFNHFLALPCGYGVWQEAATVKMSVLNPMAVFSTLFNDGMVDVCLSTNPEKLILCRLFMKFPMIVFNDVASVMNGVLGDLGVSGRIPLYEISEFIQY